MASCIGIRTSWRLALWTLASRTLASWTLASRLPASWTLASFGSQVFGSWVAGRRSLGRWSLGRESLHCRSPAGCQEFGTYAATEQVTAMTVYLI